MKDNSKSLNMRKLAMFVLLALVPIFAWAQTVTGVVKDASTNDPIPGVNVVVKGTTQGTITDFDGKYSISAKSSDVLTFSFIGYQIAEEAVNGRTSINVNLKSDTEELEEVVAVGYGTVKKSDLAGSVVSVDKEAMMRKAPTNIAQGLQGAAPGVIVTMQDGAPDANAAVRIRGVATINGSAQPLYVVDGVQVGSNANFVNPADIESIDVLKDASATAIYGSAGANGVIMITTKHGKKGSTTVNVAADWGVQTLPYTLDVCSVDQYAKNLRQARINDNQVENGKAIMWNPVWTEQYDGKRKAIDWQDEMTRVALKQQYSISASGGNEKTTYNASVGFLRNEGIVVNTQYQRINARANVHSNVNDYLEFGADVSYVHTDNYGSNQSVGNFGNLSSLRDFAFACPSMDFVTSDVVTYDGVAAGTYVSPNVVNPDGTFGEVPGGKNFNDGFWGTTLGNMYAKQMENNKRNRSNRTMSSAYLTIKPISGLSLKSLISYDYNAGSNQNFYGGIKRVNYVNGKRIDVTQGTNNAYYNPSENNDYRFDLGNNESQTLYIANTINYNWKNESHDLNIMLGNEVSRWYGQWVGGSSVGYESADNRDLSLSTQVDKKKASGGLNLESRGISYFGRLSYSLLGRYLLTATVRKDGSSNFGEGNRWGTFPSAAFGWRISEESFMENQDIFDNLKLRLGWGQTGNSGGATDLTVNGLNVDGRYVYYGPNAALGLGTSPSVITGYYQVLKDTNLKWETNEQINIGLDATVLNSITVTLDYFVRTAKDLLLYRQIRATSGHAQIYTNYGEIQNRGLEIQVGYNKQLTDDLSFNVTFTGSTLKNEVKKMGDDIFNTNSDSSGAGTGDGSNTGAVGSADGYHWGNHSICREGEAVGSFYGYKVDRVIKNESDLAAAKAQGQDKAQLGDYMFKDLNNDKVINEKDMDILGNGFPAFNYGLNIGANYKNFDFSLAMHGVAGQKVYSYSAMRLTNMFSSDDGCAPNILKESADNAWSPSNPNGSEARLSLLDENYNMRASDAWVKDANFLKISNLQVGYTLPKDITKKIQMQSARIYVGVNNLATISKYKKYGDPECGQGSVLYTGLDTGRYPMPRIFAFGLNLSF